MPIEMKRNVYSKGRRKKNENKRGHVYTVLYICICIYDDEVLHVFNLHFCDCNIENIWRKYKIPMLTINWTHIHTHKWCLSHHDRLFVFYFYFFFFQSFLWKVSRTNWVYTSMKNEHDCERTNRWTCNRACQKELKKLHLCIANHFQENIIFTTCI